MLGEFANSPRWEESKSGFCAVPEPLPPAFPLLSVPSEQRVISPALIEAYQPDSAVTLDQHLAPLKVAPSQFSDQNGEIRSDVLSISGDVHTLYVFKRIRKLKTVLSLMRHQQKANI